MSTLCPYSSGLWGDRAHYECNVCDLTSFDETRMLRHIEQEHPHSSPKMFPFLVQQEPILRQPGDFKSSITLGAIFWNNDAVFLETANGILEEAVRLKWLGIKTDIAFALAEPLPETMANLKLVQITAREYEINCFAKYFTMNVGSCVLRNVLVDANKESDYLFMVDGDIEPVPYSALAMVDLMHVAPFPDKRLGCVGAYSGSYSNDRQQVSHALHTIPPALVKFDPFIAWTQYGLFSREVLNVCRFDENYGPGWGFEDDDYATQMRSHGFTTANFRGIRYLHRNVRSSWQGLRDRGLEPEILFNKRKAYYLAKWRGMHHNVDAMQFPR